MRDFKSPAIHKWRTRHPVFGMGDDLGGYFMVFYGGVRLRVLASKEGEWDHVSVSLATRCPTWNEMDFIKRLFFEKHETAMQLHVAEEDHISLHHFTLHIWRPHDLTIPLPPKEYV